MSLTIDQQCRAAIHAAERRYQRRARDLRQRGASPWKFTLAQRVYTLDMQRILACYGTMVCLRAAACGAYVKSTHGSRRSDRLRSQRSLRLS